MGVCESKELTRRGAKRVLNKPLYLEFMLWVINFVKSRSPRLHFVRLQCKCLFFSLGSSCRLHFPSFFAPPCRLFVFASSSLFFFFFMRRLSSWLFASAFFSHMSLFEVRIQPRLPSSYSAREGVYMASERQEEREVRAVEKGSER